MHLVAIFVTGPTPAMLADVQLLNSTGAHYIFLALPS